MATSQSTAIQSANTKPEQNLAEIMERVLIGGDLSKLNTTERLSYYKAVCDSVGLNPLTKPFEYITLNGKLTLYARKDATDQLRSLREVSVTGLDAKVIDGIYIVTTCVQNDEGRTDIATGAVQIDHLKGEAKANAMMKAETKSKRRATLSICGLGMLDETEVESIAAEPTAPKAIEPPLTDLQYSEMLSHRTTKVDGGYEVVDLVGEVFTVIRGVNGIRCSCGSEGRDQCHHRVAVSIFAQRKPAPAATAEPEPADLPSPAEMEYGDEPQTITKAQLISLCELTKQLEAAGIEEITWRDQLENICGSRSRKGVMQDELAKVVFAFNNALTAQLRKGGKAKAK